MIILHRVGLCSAVCLALLAIPLGGLAAQTTAALIVTPRTVIDKAHLEGIDYSLRVALQATGITLAPAISTALGSLAAKQYPTFSSKPDEVKAAAEAIGVNNLILVDVTSWDEKGMGWNWLECILVLPWLWHPFGIYDFTDVGAQVGVFNANGQLLCLTRATHREIGIWGLGILFMVPTRDYEKQRVDKAVTSLAGAIASQVFPHLQI